MQKVFCFGSFFLFQVYRYKPLLFRKKNLITPYPFEVCPCVLNFMVIGQYTINIPENSQASTIFSV